MSDDGVRRASLRTACSRSQELRRTLPALAAGFTIAIVFGAVLSIVLTAAGPDGMGLSDRRTSGWIALVYGLPMIPSRSSRSATVCRGIGHAGVAGASAFEVDGQVMEAIASRLAEVADETSASAPSDDAEAPEGNRHAFSHDAIKARSQTHFVRSAVDGIEDWLTSQGVRVQHNRRSNHSMYVWKRWIGGYYFARGWVHFWLVRRDPSDPRFEELSQAASLLTANPHVR